MVFLDPAAVRPPPRQVHLDLGVLHQAPRRQIRQQHRAGAQRAFFRHLVRRQVQHAGLGRQHHEAVLRHRVAHRPQPVAVQRRPHQPPVGERHRRRPVPRFHQPRVVFEESAQVRTHRVFRAPRLRNQHQHRVVDLAPAQRQQLEHVVEVRAVAAEILEDRQQLFDVAPERLGFQLGLARGHGVAVAAQGVDLAVVRQHAERLRQRPGGERVRRIALVHHRHRADHARVRQVRIELRHLRGDHHALVDQRAAREARRVGVRGVVRRLAPQLVLRALARDQQLALKRIARQPALRLGREHLPERGHRGPRRRPHRLRIRRHLAPAQRAQAFFEQDPLHPRLRIRQFLAARRQEQETHAVLARLRQRKAQPLGLFPEKAVGNLDQQTRAVARVRIRPRRPAVQQVHQHLDALFDDPVLRPPVEVQDETHPARVVFVPRVVQSYGFHPVSPSLPSGPAFAGKTILLSYPLVPANSRLCRPLSPIRQERRPPKSRFIFVASGIDASGPGSKSPGRRVFLPVSFRPSRSPPFRSRPSGCGCTRAGRE